MSTYEYRPNGENTLPVYKIGVRDHVGRQKTADISTFALIVPTYGAWAGPSWAANHRSSTTSTINWDFDPCMNENIKQDGADPNKCYSMIDAMAKQHDWNYTIAEHSQNGDEASLKMTADEILLEDVKQYYFGGTYTCITGLGSIEADEIETGDYELQTISYISTSLDATEIQYAADLSIAFTFKSVGDALCVAKENVVNTFKSIWGYVTDTLGNIITSTDGNQTITTQKTTDGDFLCICDGEKARLLDTDAYKEYNIGRIVLGGGSMATASNFVYEGDGKICLYGGTGDDIITTGENENATYYTFVGGDGFDTYYLTDGNRYEIADNGANEIYKKNENGGWDSVGDMYADATGTVWYSADHSCQLTHSSPWTLTFADGTTVVLGDSFESGDFGINLIALPTSPTAYNTIDLDMEDPTNTDHRGVHYGTSGSDKIIGGSGNDEVMTHYLETGNDWLIGGGGNDMVQAFGNPDDCILEGNAGVDALIGSFGSDRLFCGASDSNSDGQIDTMEQGITRGETASNLNTTGDLVYGGAGNDFIDGVGGDDEIYGGAGSDTLFGDVGNDFIEGGEGDDYLFGDRGLVGETGADYIDGGSGNDYIEGQDGHDELFGGADNDTIYGGEGDDHIDGEAGADSLYGGAGADVMFGGDNNDYMEGDHYDVAGDDYLDGEAGNDTIIGAGGADIIFGGADDDSLYGDATNVAVADHGDDYIDGESGHNLIVGFGGNDTLYALDGNDTIYGGDGNDDIDAGDGGNMVLGGAGHDDIWAGKDNDWIQGDAGNDELFGGKVILFRKKPKYQNIWRRFAKEENLRRAAV